MGKILHACTCVALILSSSVRIHINKRCEISHCSLVCFASDFAAAVPGATVAISLIMSDEY
eukprot:scaffold114845_cov47-Prasinocladus_malaysianus.AAC.5